MNYKNVVNTFLIMALILLVSIGFNTNTAEASTEEITDINESLSKLVDEINEDLSNGEKASSKSIMTEEGGRLTLSVGESVPTHPSTSMQPNNVNLYSTISTKTYNALIGYDGVGLNFSHQIEGTYQVSNAKVSNVTYSVAQTGWAYQKTHNTSVQKIDDSVQKVTSAGYFNAFKYGKQYVAYLDVTVYGTGDYRITKASITK